MVHCNWFLQLSLKYDFLQIFKLEKYLFAAIIIAMTSLSHLFSYMHIKLVLLKYPFLGLQYYFDFTFPSDIQECLTMPCMNNGRCIDLEDGFRCECSQAYTGEYCQNDANECELSNPCQHEGTCVNTHGSYRCRCKEGWKGRNCELGQDIVKQTYR